VQGTMVPQPPLPTDAARAASGQQAQNTAVLNTMPKLAVSRFGPGGDKTGAAVRVSATQGIGGLGLPMLKLGSRTKTVPSKCQYSLARTLLNPHGRLSGLLKLAYGPGRSGMPMPRYFQGISGFLPS
jgi:hypothetical protein